MGGAFYSWALGRECDFPAVAGDVSGAGGDGGSVTGVDNFPAVIKAGRICNDMGMDTISAGVTVGCAMELSERGYLPEKDVGYKLNFGSEREYSHWNESLI